jgi:TonB family protein
MFLGAASLRSPIHRPMRKPAAALALALAAAPALHAQSGRPPVQRDTARYRQITEAFDTLTVRVFARLRANGVEHPDGKLQVAADSAHSVVTPGLSGSTVADAGLRGVAEETAAAVAVWPRGVPVMASFRLDAEKTLDPAGKPDPTRPQKTLPPVIANRGEFLGVLERSLYASGLGAREVNRAAPAELAMKVDEQGQVVAVVVIRATGRAELDQFLLPIGYAARFEPARTDGTPVPVWADLPIVFHMQ